MKQETKNKTHTLIISDFHLGSKVSRSEDLIKFLNSFKFKKLILLGDIFESLNFRKLNKYDWELLSLLGNVSRESKVIWVAGNHDAGLTDFFTSLTDVRVRNVYKWKYQNKKYLAIHGHQFDNFLVNNAIISFWANQVYKLIQLLDFKDKRISRAIKRKSKGWLRISNKVASRATIYARVMQVDYIFCGHTHKAMESNKGDVHYYNCGCWTDIPATYITLDKSEMKIEQYL
ncbi:MAG: UDP-2,3-diacylglucosamine diphosphatase [Candidatus Moranbacteria bacterium]|jgi:UDP-2,3-diacylglucosamine pyrophosphatase LpxH|nr:UDP-2,3-diacylglucosamine diphosphatase [Candidatus Moranbacteria bacterium]